MKINIIRKIEQLEKKVSVKKKETPDLVLISYEEETQDYSVSETYMEDETYKKDFRIKNLNEYIITPEMNFTRMIIDLIALEGGNLFVIKGGELLEGVGEGSSVSIEFIGQDPEEKMKGLFNINEIVKRRGK